MLLDDIIDVRHYLIKDYTQLVTEDMWCELRTKQIKYKGKFYKFKYIGMIIPHEYRICEHNQFKYWITKDIPNDPSS